MGRALIIILAGTLSYLTMANISSSRKLNDGLEVSVDYYGDTQARNIANSVVQIQLAKLGDSTDFRAKTSNKISIFGGKAEYYVKDTTVASEDFILISSKASYFGNTKRVSVLVNPVASGFKPAGVKAAVSTNNNIQTLGNLVVDGRDHDKNGNLMSGQGTLGIWTTGSMNQGGNSHIGGYSSGTDYSPSKPGNSNIIKANQVWPGGYPDTPDKVMGGSSEGFPEGTLKSVAQSGVNGSQYVTNPSSLTSPLKGITYVELPTKTKGNKNAWISADVSGSGILIVHNSATNAIIKTLKGTFKGIIIADDIDKVHGDLIGALVGITSSPASGNCIGNGNGKVFYSSEAILEATGSLGGGGNPQNYGFGATRLTVESWYE